MAGLLVSVVRKQKDECRSPFSSLFRPLPSPSSKEYCHPHLGDVFNAQLELSGKTLANREVYLLGDSKSSQPDKEDVKCDQHAPPSYGVFLVPLPCSV